jgi:hypothetical protein
MPKTLSENKRLTRVTRIALSLPQVKRELHGSHATFLVRKKPFAYYLNNHHGDGIVGVTCKVLPGENKSLVEAQPQRFYPPPHISLHEAGSRYAWTEARLTGRR